MNIIMDRIKTLRLVEGDSINISCRNGKTYEHCIVKSLPKTQEEELMEVELLDNHHINIHLAEIKIIRKIA